MSYYDSGYAPVWNPILVADLIELLMYPDVQWFEVEELLIGESVETRFVRLLHANRAYSPVFFGRPPSVDFAMDEDARQILLHRLFPYATLLDTRLTPFEQARQLHQAGVDVAVFCDWLQGLPSGFHENHHLSLYREAGRAVDQAWKDHFSLLRGAERSAEPIEHLLRAAGTAATPQDNLLRPEMPVVPDPSTASPSSESSYFLSSFSQRIRRGRLYRFVNRYTSR